MEDWIIKAIEREADKLAAESKDNSNISIVAISNVPYIQYPGFTKEECEEVFNQTKETLRFAKYENSCNEVAITYDKRCIQNTYFKIKGDFSSVPIMGDEKTRNLLQTNNESGEIVVVSIHNHPDISVISVNDLLVFNENPSIKLMVVVNKDGQVSFLERTGNNKLPSIVINNILQTEPNFSAKMTEWKLKNPNKEFTLRDILNKEQIKTIFEESIREMQTMGVIYSPYIGKKEAEKLEFNTNQYASESQKIYNLTNFSFGEFLGSGEDGFGAEEREG